MRERERTRSCGPASFLQIALKFDDTRSPDRIRVDEYNFRAEEFENLSRFFSDMQAERIQATEAAKQHLPLLLGFLTDGS